MVTVDPVCYAVLAAYYSLLNLPLKCRKALRLADRYGVILFCMIEAVSHLPSLLPSPPSYPLTLSPSYTLCLSSLISSTSVLISFFSLFSLPLPSSFYLFNFVSLFLLLFLFLFISYVLSLRPQWCHKCGG